MDAVTDPQLPVAPPDVQQVFPPDHTHVTRPRHVDAEVRRSGTWVPARVLAWYLRESPPLARLEWPDPDSGEMVPVVVTYAAGAIRPRHRSDASSPPGDPQDAESA